MSTDVGLRVETRTSGIWQLSSVVLSAGGECLVVDPGYFPRELAELAALASSRGQATGVAFTHGHWDHVLGWQTFPSARVYGSTSLAAAVAGSSPTAEKNLAEARDFDGRWYVERASPIAWPGAIVPLAEGARLEVGGVALQALSLPGHSADGLALLAPEPGLLIVGDYLSPCEIPFVEALADYRRTLTRLIDLLVGVEEVIPGHGPRLTAPAARQLARADLDYLDALAERALASDVSGALAVPLPRARDVPGMLDHHRDNVRAAGLSVP